MTNRLRKQSCHTARRARHERKRAEKREAARSHSKQTPRNQRSRSNVLQFPKEWQGLFQSNRRKAVAA